MYVCMCVSIYIYIYILTHTHAHTLLYIGEKVTTTLIYENINSLFIYESHAEVAVWERLTDKQRKRRINRKPLWLATGWDRYIHSLASFMGGWYRAGYQLWGCHPPFGFHPKWHDSPDCWLTALSADWPPTLRGWKISIVFDLSDTHAFFLRNSHGISTVPCLS